MEMIDAKQMSGLLGIHPKTLKIWANNLPENHNFTIGVGPRNKTMFLADDAEKIKKSMETKHRPQKLRLTKKGQIFNIKGELKRSGKFEIVEMTLDKIVLRNLVTQQDVSIERATVIHG